MTLAYHKISNNTWKYKEESRCQLGSFNLEYATLANILLCKFAYTRTETLL